MKIAIISAMDKERRLIYPMMENVIEKETAGLRVDIGKIGNHDIVLSKCGIGKVNAAINTYKIIDSYNPDLIINSGVAGGASLRTRIGDILVADYVAYHDVWCGPGTDPGQADGMNVFMECDPRIIKIAYEELKNDRLQVGLICSGDRFITEEREIKEIQSIFPEVVAVDMESAAIAQVCVMEGIRFNIIRVVSDTPGSGCNIEQYSNFWQEAPEKTFDLIQTILNKI